MSPHMPHIPQRTDKRPHTSGSRPSALGRAVLGSVPGGVEAGGPHVAEEYGREGSWPAEVRGL